MRSAGPAIETVFVGAVVEISIHLSIYAFDRDDSRVGRPQARYLAETVQRFWELEVSIEPNQTLVYGCRRLIEESLSPIPLQQVDPVIANRVFFTSA